MARPQAVGDGAVADQLDAVEHAGLAAEVLLGQVRAVPVAVRQAVDGDVAVVVVERGEQPRERQQRVRRGAAELPAVQGVLERAQRHRELAVAAQRRAQRRLPQLPVAAVGDHHHVGAQQLGVALDDLEELLAAVLLGALDQHLDVHGRLEVVRAQRGEVGDDAGLVVGGAAAVQAAVADRARTGRCPSRPAARAGRRSGRRAGRSARAPLLGEDARRLVRARRRSGRRGEQLSTSAAASSSGSRG